MQSSAKNEEIVRKSIDAFNQRDWKTALECCTEDSKVIDMPTGQTYVGHDGWMTFLKNAVEAFPDAELDLTHVVAGEDYVATRCTFRGTHKGALPFPTGELKPTGTKIEVKAAGWFPMVDGKIQEYVRYSDTMGFLSQLGMKLTIA